MSLMDLSQKSNREQEERFLAQTEELAASEGPPEPQGIVGRNEAMMDRVKGGAQPRDEGPSASGATTAPRRVLDQLEERAARRPDGGDEAAPAAPPSTPPEPDDEGWEPVGPPPLRAGAATRDENASRSPAPLNDPEGGEPEEGPASPPDGIPDGSSGVLMTEEDRVAALAEKIRGSVGDGGSIEDHINGLPPRPSVASQREIREFERRLIGGLELKKPVNWPEFMMYPTYDELRALNREGVTREMIGEFEAQKQLQADAMEARAKELNGWIFSFGDMRLNEKHQMARSRNRDAAIKKRSLDDKGEERKENRPDPSEITDEELYKDRYYGIRFATLLNTDPDHINRLRQAPVAAWGHDMARTVDGGRVRVTGDEIRAVTVSAQAAQLIVMEAQARGWETLRISGDNEFCAAVKKACKEQGMGAIITRRGPLGLGPFSRPEVVMPRLPDPLGPVQPGPQDEQRKRKEEAAPGEDRDAAAALLGSDPKAGPKPADGGRKRRLDEVDVEGPFDTENGKSPPPEAPRMS